MKTKIIAVAVVLASFGWNVEAQTYDTNNEVVSTFAGSGFSGYVDGVGQSTMFNRPSKIAADSFGNLFVLDGGNARIRKITPDGTVSTFAGGGAGSLPGYGTNVDLSYYLPYSDMGSMIVDKYNNLFLTRTVNSPLLIKIATNGYISTSSL